MSVLLHNHRLLKRLTFLKEQKNHPSFIEELYNEQIFNYIMIAY